MPSKSFLSRGPGNSKNGQSVSHARSKKQEKELAKKGSGRLTPGSGNRFQKGDVKRYSGVFRVEAKTTKRKSFSITREMIEKIEEAALPYDELPAIVVEFIDELGKKEAEVCVVPRYVLDELGMKDG